MSSPEKMKCFSRPARGNLVDGFEVCRQGHALHLGNHFDLETLKVHLASKKQEVENPLDDGKDADDPETTSPVDQILSESLHLVLSDESDVSLSGDTIVLDHNVSFSLSDEASETSLTPPSPQNSFEDTLILDHDITFSEPVMVTSVVSGDEILLDEVAVGIVLEVDDMDVFDNHDGSLDELSGEALDDSWFDPDWKDPRERTLSEESDELQDDGLDDSVFVPIINEASTTSIGTKKKLVEYSFSEESEDEVVGGNVEEADGFDFEDGSSVVWSVSDASDSDEEITLAENILNEATAVESNVEETNLINDVARALEYSSGSDSDHSPEQNRDLLTPPSQPSSGPSSPLSVPTTPAAFGPRTPRVLNKTPSAQPAGLRASHLDSSPFRRPSHTTVMSSPIPSPQLSNIPSDDSMRGALTHRLNKLVVKNKTSHPVPDYLKDALMENNLDRGLKFTLSHLMNDQMLLDNNLLKKNKGPIDRKKGVTINWQCLSQNCYYRATTVDADVEKTNGNHNHDPNVELFVKREGRLKLKEAVAVSDAPLASVVLNVISQTTDDAYLTAHGSNAAMKQCARRFKQSQFPDLGKQLAIKDLIIDPLWFEIRPGGNETVLLFDNGAGGRETEVEGRRIVAFGSKVHLNLLLRSLDWMGDGTFDVSPYIGKEKFYQLYTIAGFVRRTAFTLLRVLMQKKDANSYKELFNFLLKTAVDNGWQFKMVEEGGMFLTDFEWAPHLAKNHVLSETSLIPGSKVVVSSGCNFHFASGIMKDNNVKHRMKLLYDKSDEHRGDVRMLMMLVYVPDQDIPRVYDVVAETLRNKGSKAVALLPRLTKNFVHGYERPSDQKLILPRFPPSMWSCYTRVLEDKPSTTNFLEGSHRGYDFKFMKNHPSFKDFGSCLAKDIRSVEKDIGLVNENQEHLVQRKRRQELERTASIKTSCLMYKTGFSTGEVLDYLKNLSKITSRTLRGTNVDEEEV